jgi:hypothetical protein
MKMQSFLVAQQLGRR